MRIFTIDVGILDNAFAVSTFIAGRWINHRTYGLDEFDKLLAEHDKARHVVCDERTKAQLRKARPHSTKLHGTEFYIGH